MEMEKFSIVLVSLFIILLIGQYYMTEFFVDSDISNAKVTMSLSDLLYYGGNKVSTQTIHTYDRRPSAYDSSSAASSASASASGSLDSYLFLKNEMTREFKEHLRKTNGSYSSFKPSNVEPPSCTQGSSYMETVPLKVPASASASCS